MYVYQQKGTKRFAFSLVNLGKTLRSRQGLFTLQAEVEASKETHSGWKCRKVLENAYRASTQQNGDVPDEPLLATDLFGQFTVVPQSEFLALC